MRFLTIMVLFLTSFLVSCGGGGGGGSGGSGGASTDSSSGGSSIVVSGTGGKGLFGGAVVEVFAINANGTVGSTVIASTTTLNGNNTWGSFSLSVPSSTSAYIIQLRTVVGTTQMLDETTIVNGVQAKIPAPSTPLIMRTYIGSATSNATVSVNPFTEMAVSSVSSGNFSATNLDQAAHVVKTQILGGDVDPFKTVAPAGITAPVVTDSSITSDQLKLFSWNAKVAKLAITYTGCSSKGSIQDKFQCVIMDATNGLNSTFTPSNTPTIAKNTLLTQLYNAPLPSGVNVGAYAPTIPTTTVATGIVTGIPSATTLNNYKAASTFASSLTTATTSFSKYAVAYSNSLKDIGSSYNGYLDLVYFLTTALSRSCSIPSSTTLTCTPQTILYGAGLSGIYIQNIDYVGCNWQITLTAAGSNIYNYSLKAINGSSSYGKYSACSYTSNPTTSSVYSGSLSLSNSVVTLSGKVPVVNLNSNGSFGYTPVRTADVSMSVGSNILTINNTTQNQSITSTLNLNINTPADSTSKAASLVIKDGSIKLSYYPNNVSGDNRLAFNSLSGTATLTVDTSTLVANINLLNTPVENSANTMYRDSIGSSSIAGTLTTVDSNGVTNTAKASINLTTDYTKVDFTKPVSSTNYALGGISADLQLYDASQANYAQLILTDQRKSYTSASLTAKAIIGSDKALWVQLDGSYPINVSSAGLYDYLNFNTNESSSSWADDLVTISSSGGFKGTYSQKTSTANINDSNGNLIGKIMNGQLYIDGGITLVYFNTALNNK